MNSNLTKLADNTIEITVDAAWNDVQKTYDQVVDELVKEVELPGFRKGNAPKSQALEKIGQTKINEEFLKHVVPEIWNEIVKKHDLKPVIYPKISVQEFDLEKNLKLKIITAEKPDIKLKNYREAITQKRKARQSQIWTPKDGKDKTKAEKLTISDVMSSILEATEITIPGVIVEQEVNRMLANLLDQTQKLGMTVEQYLQAQNKTSASLRAQYAQEAKNTLALELALEQIADAEKIEVSDAEIDGFINQAKTEEEKKTLEQQKYYIGSLLRRQKTLNTLLEAPVVTA